MMIPQQSSANVVQIATSLGQNTGHNTSAVATYSQDGAAQIRFVLPLQICCTVSVVAQYLHSMHEHHSSSLEPTLPVNSFFTFSLHLFPSRFPAAPQLLTKLVTGQMACGAVMVPTTMFMGQVVTAFAHQQGQTQNISQQSQHQHQHHQQQQQQQEQQVQPQSQMTAMQPGQAPLGQQQTQFLQVTLTLNYVFSPHVTQQKTVSQCRAVDTDILMFTGVQLQHTEKSHMHKVDIWPDTFSTLVIIIGLQWFSRYYGNKAEVTELSISS